MNEINILDSFIQKHISSVNKNNIIVIHIGKNISKQIFSNVYPTNKIKNIIKKLKNISNVTVDPPIYSKSYFCNNTIFKVYSNKVMNYSYTCEDNTHLSYNHIDCKLIYMKINNKPNLNSNYNYNNIEEQEEIIIHYKNYFNINIVKYINNTYGINISIHKPIDQKIILNNIRTVIDLL